jgi:hypothetical protein
MQHGGSSAGEGLLGRLLGEAGNGKTTDRPYTSVQQRNATHAAPPSRSFSGPDSVIDFLLDLDEAFDQALVHGQPVLAVCISRWHVGQTAPTEPR